MKPHTIHFLAFALFLPLLSASPYRAYVSPDGQEIEARYIKSEGTTIHLERSDGRRFATPIARFDERTQGVILFEQEQRQQRAHELLLSGDPIPSERVGFLETAGTIEIGQELFVTGRVSRIHRTGTRGEHWPIYRVHLSGNVEVQVDFRDRERSNRRTYLASDRRVILDEFSGIPSDQLNPVEDLIEVGEAATFVVRYSGRSAVNPSNRPLILSNARLASGQDLREYRLRVAAMRSPGDFERTARIEQLRSDIALLEEEIRTGVAATTTGSYSGITSNAYGGNAYSRGTTESITRFTPAQIEAKKSERAIKRAQLETYLAE